MSKFFWPIWHGIHYIVCTYSIILKLGHKIEAVLELTLLHVMMTIPHVARFSLCQCLPRRTTSIYSGGLRWRGGKCRQPTTCTQSSHIIQPPQYTYCETPQYANDVLYATLVASIVGRSCGQCTTMRAIHMTYIDKHILFSRTHTHTSPTHLNTRYSISSSSTFSELMYCGWTKFVSHYVG